MIYNKLVQECFFSPLHAGRVDLDNPLSILVRNGQKNQAIIELSLQYNVERRIIHAYFKTNGNPYLIAGLEWLCRQLEKQCIDNLPLLDYQLLVSELEIPTAQYPLALRIIEVYKEVLFLIKKKMNREVI